MTEARIAYLCERSRSGISVPADDVLGIELANRMALIEAIVLECEDLAPDCPPNCELKKLVEAFKKFSKEEE